jgi:hypothetical protein
MATRWINANERSVYMATGVHILANRNAKAISEPSYEEWDRRWQGWCKEWPDMVRDAEIWQAAIFDQALNY